MDFHALKRKELQSLCKKHGIPANLKNVEMVDRLSALLSEEKLAKRGRSCLKNLSVVGDGDEEVTESKEPKRVKFSPQNETFIFEKTDPREMRLRARKKRAFEESKMEENPVSDNGNLGDMDYKSVDNVQKPNERILRRRSVVVYRPVERISRRTSVVKPDAVSDTENVDKPIERILRRRSVLVKSDALLDSKVIDKDMLLSPCIENKVKQSRKGQGKIGRGAAEEFDKPQDELLKELRSAEMAAEISGKDGDGVGLLDKNNLAESGKARRPVRKGKKAKAQGHASASKENRKDEASDQAVEMAPNIKKGTRGRKKLATFKKQEVTKASERVVEDLGEGNDWAYKISESEGVKRIGLRKKNNNVDGDVGFKEKKVARRSHRQAGMSKVDASSSEQVVGEVKVHKSINHLAMADHQMEAKCINGVEAIGCSSEKLAAVETDYVLDKEIMLSASTPKPSLSERRELKVDELCQATRCSSSAEKIAENSKEITECSPISSEKPYGVNNTMQLQDCPEEMDTTVKVPENAVAADEAPANNERSMFQNSGDGEAESFVQANKVAEASNLNYVPDQNSYEATKLAPPSVLRRQSCGTLCGIIAEQTCVGIGEPICNAESSDVSGPGEEQPSSTLGKLRSEMRDPRTFESNEGLERDNQIQKFELENLCKVSPSLRNSSKFENSAEENMIECAAINIEKSDVQPAMQEETPGSMGSCDRKFKEVEQTISTFSVDIHHFIVEEKAVLGPVVSVKPPNVLEGQTLSSNASAATLKETMEDGEYIKTVPPLQYQRTDSISNDTADSHLIQSLNKDDGGARTEPSSINTFLLYLESQVDGAIGVLSRTMRKEEECCKETLRDCSANSINANNLPEEDTPIISKQRHEVNVFGDDITNSNVSKELKHEKSPRVTEQDGFSVSNGVETPALFHETAYEENISSGIFGSIRKKASECFPVSDTTKNLQQRSMDAIEASESFSKNNCPVNFEDRELLEALHFGNESSCPGVEGICIDVSEHNSAVETIAAEDKLEVQLKDADKSPDWNNTPQEQTHRPFDYLCDTFVDHSGELTAPSGSLAEEGHKETPSRDISCFANDTNADYVAENDKCIYIKQPQEANCLQHLGSENDITYFAQSKELESERVAWTTEQHLLGLGSQVENPVLSADLALDGDTLPCNASECVSTVSDHTKDLEIITVKDSEDSIDEGVDNVTTLQFQDGEAAKISHLANAISNGKLTSVSNGISESNIIKETTIPVREIEFCLGDDGTCADLSRKTNGKPMDTNSPTCGFSPFTAQKKTNLRFEIDKFTVLASKSVDSFEKNVETLAHDIGHVEETEGMNTCKNESPDSTTPNELIEAIGEPFKLETKNVGSVEKELENIPQQAGTVEGATEGANSGEKESFKSNSEGELGEAVESGLAVQNSLLVAVPEEGKSDGGDEMVDVCPMEVNQVHIIGSEDSDSCIGHLEMAEKSCSLKGSFGKFSLGNAASDSLLTSQGKTCYETLQNGLHSDEPMLLKDNQDKEGIKVDAEVEKSDALPFKSSMPDEIISQALVCEMHDGPGSIAKQNLAEFPNTREIKLQGLTISPFSVINCKIEGAEGNCEPDIDEPTGNVNSAVMVESHSFCENEKGDRDIEGALEYAPAEQFDSHMISGNRPGLENVNEEQIDLHMDAAEGQNCTIGNGNTACNRSKEFGGQPGDIAEKSMNSEAELEFNADEAYDDDTQEVDSAKIPDVRISQDDRDADAIFHEKSINSEADLEFNADEAYNDDTQELDSSECPGVRDTQDVRGYSVEKEAHTLPRMLPMTLDSLITMHDVLESTSSQKSVDVSAVHEMEQEVLRDYPCTLFNQESDNRRRGNFEPTIESKDDITHVKRSSNPPSSVSENKGVNLDASENIVVDSAAGDGIAFSNSMEDHGEIAAEHFFRPPESEIVRDVNDYDASDNKVDVDSSSRCVCENFTHQRQEQNHTSLIHSYQQMDPTDSACQQGMMTAILFENEDMKSNMESCLFTDSEIDLFWGTMAKDEVRELQREATDVTFSVNEYEIGNVDNERRLSTHQSAVEEIMELENFVKEKVAESGEGQQLGEDVDLGELALEDGNKREETGHSIDQVADNLRKVAKKSSDLHEQLGNVGDLGEQKFHDDNQREERDDSVDQVADEQNCINVEENETSGNNLGKAAEKSANLNTDDKVLMSSSIQRHSTRSILIHGTPRKPPVFAHDMKENTPAPKRLQMVNATGVKPSFKRKALEDIRK